MIDESIVIVFNDFVVIIDELSWFESSSCILMITIAISNLMMRH